MAQGTVKWFNGTKGFGFITPAGGGAGLFVHQSQFLDCDSRGIAENQRVEFEIGEGRRGAEATGAKLL